MCGNHVLCDVVCHNAFSAWGTAILLGFADGAMLPAVQTLLLKYVSDRVTGRIFGYNQSFMYLGNVAGPLLGASVSAMAGFRWVFIATAIVVFINLIQLAFMLRRCDLAAAAR